MEVRDKRTQRRFFVDNTIIRDYGPLLGPIGIAVYSALCMHADLEDQTCFPRHKTIAKEIGACEKSVRTKLKQLAELNLITWEQRRRGGAQTSNLYTLLNPPSLLPVEPTVTDTATDGSEYRPQTVTDTDKQSPSDNPHLEQSPIPPAAEGTPTALSERIENDQREEQDQTEDQEEEQRTNKITTRTPVPTMEVPIDGGTVIVRVPPPPNVPPEIYGSLRSYNQGKELWVYPEDTDQVEVAEIWLEPEDTQLTCPHCDHTQPWPQTEGRRRRPSSLICQLGAGEPMDGCGTYFIVHGFKKNGSNFAYKLRIPEADWSIKAEGTKWATIESEATEFLAHWDEDSSFMLEKLKWSKDRFGPLKMKDVVIERANAAFVRGMKNRAARQAEAERPSEEIEVLIDAETGQRYVEEPRY